MVKEKPILFSAPMIRCIQNTKPGVWPAERIDPARPFKCQTRRLFKGKNYDWWQACGGEIGDDGLPIGEDDMGDPVTIPAAYQVGDILWVREGLVRIGPTWCYRADDQPVWVGIENIAAMAGWVHHKQQDYCPSMFMPRWACRIRLEVMEVRCQRLQDITEEDAKAEGAKPWPHDPQQRMTTGELGIEQPYRGGFACLWDDINEDRATWNSNPWVWAYTFKRLEVASA